MMPKGGAKEAATKLRSSRDGGLETCWRDRLQLKETTMGLEADPWLEVSADTLALTRGGSKSPTKEETRRSGGSSGQLPGG